MTLGIPVAYRDHPDTAEVVGYLVDTLPLRLCPDPHATLAETLDATRARVDDVRAHPRMPLEELLREARPQGDRGPLFQALLAVNGTPPRYELAYLEMSPAPVPFRTTPYDLVVQAEERDGRVTGHLLFNTDLFERSTAQLIADRLATVVQALADGHPLTVAEVDVRSVGSGSGWVRCRRVRRWRMKRRVGWRSCSRGWLIAWVVRVWRCGARVRRCCSGSWRSARTGWRGVCVVRAWGRVMWWACCCRGRWTWWLPCWVC